MTIAHEDMLNAATISAGPFSQAVSIDVDGVVSEVQGVLLDGDDTRPVGHMSAREPGRHVRVRSEDIESLGLRQGVTVTINTAAYTVTSIEPDSTGQTKLFLRLAA